MIKPLYVLVVILVLIASAEAVKGCICAYIPPSRSFDIAHAVFTGDVIKIGKHEWTVVVSKVWKGEVEEVITLRDPLPRTSCSVSYKKGERRLFLVNVKQSAGKVVYTRLICSWGIRLKSARLILEDGTSEWVEDLVLKGRGEGYAPVKRIKSRTTP